MTPHDSPALARRADIALIARHPIAVLGYGTQGRAHALNLRDAGCQVVIGQRPGPSRDAATSAGFATLGISDAVKQTDIVILALPDETAPALYQEEIRPHLTDSHTLAFLHGFNIHFRRIQPPPDVDVVLLGPKGQGRAVRQEYVAGRGVAALLAVHQDASGHALDTALGWAAGIGAHRTGLILTTFKDETETDLFGEQAVLCGGLTSLIKAGFDTLVEAGYPPELAYFECCHEVKLIVDLIYEGGLTYMRERISNTAQFGDVTRGPRVIDEHTRNAMRNVLTEIRSGRFADEWREETAAGFPKLREYTDADRVKEIERVGARLRTMMWGRPTPDDA